MASGPFAPGLSVPEPGRSRPYPGTTAKRMAGNHPPCGQKGQPPKGGGKGDKSGFTVPRDGKGRGLHKPPIQSDDGPGESRPQTQSAAPKPTQKKKKMDMALEEVIHEDEKERKKNRHTHKTLILVTLSFCLRPDNAAISKTRKRFDFYSVPPKNVSAIFCDCCSDFLAIFCSEICGKTCDFALCNLKTQRFFCDCDLLGR